MKYIWLTTLLITGLAFAKDPASIPDFWPEDARRDVKWLDPEGHSSFPALLRQSEQVKVEGNAILIPEAGKSVVSPYHMTYLRETLAALGWTTLLIEPPKWPDTSNSSFWNSYREELLIRINTAHKITGELRGRTLIIAEGLSAASVMKLFADGELPMPEALVVVSPYIPDLALNQEIVGWFGQSEYPLLDIYSQGENSYAASTVKARAIAAHKQVRLDFRQKQLALTTPNVASQTWLTRQIHGWIDHLGW